MEINWQSPFEKESHPHKCLYCHEDEVKRIFRDFAEFFEIKNERVLKIIEKVIEYHDKGKLNPKWSFENNVSHSDYSVKYYFDELKKKNKQPREEDYLITFLILKHHGTLRPTTKFEDYKSIVNEFKPGGCLRDWFFNNFDFKDRIDLADAYGIFKLADCLSASGNTSFKFKKPKLSYEDLKEFLKDDKRRKEQEEIVKIGRIGFLRAPTGWGKTKASPFYFLDKKINKVFFIFPTITAINKLFSEFKKLFGEEIGKYFYFYDVEVYEKHNESWIAQYEMLTSKYFLKPYMITTIDQLLLSFLQIGSYYMKRLMFKNSAIIIDEVHLLNARMLYFLLHFLKTFQKHYNFNILFMSATLPDGLKESIEEELEIKIREKDFVDKKEKYKELKRVKFELRNELLENAIPEIVERSEKNRVLVICNTVEYAVKLKKKIEEESPDVKCLLLHARFVYNSRKKREKRIEELRKEPHILISTQVCEVSLDISYDYLYTELAPISSLVQRFGRVNRYGKTTEKTNVFTFKPWIKNEKHYPYEIDELKEAEKILREINELKNEYQLIEKINELLPKEKFMKEIENQRKEVNLETFFENETKTGYFFTTDLNEEEAQRLLSYRESFTTLVIPFENIVDGDEVEKMKNKIEKLWRMFKSTKDREKLQEIFSKLKGFVVPIPFYWVKGLSFEKTCFPIIVEKTGKYIYHVKYGFVNERFMDVIL